MDNDANTNPLGEPGTTTKQMALRAIAELPDDADFDDVIEQLEFVYEVQRGLEDIAAGRVVSQEEARRRMARWLT